MNWFSLLSGESASVAWAMIGGLAVAAGLIIEKFAEILNEKFLGEYNAHKKLEWTGWYVLMVGILIEVADAGWTAHAISNAERMADLNKKPIFAFSAYVYIVVKPSDQENDLETTNLPVMPWAPGCALFPFRPIPIGNSDSVWLELGHASKFEDSLGASGASVSSDCVIKSVALNGKEKFIRFDMYFGIDADNKTVPTPNRSFQNLSMTPMDLNAVNFVLPTRGQVIEGRIEMSIDNGQIERFFQIPKQSTFGSSVSCVESNGIFLPIDWSPKTREDFAKSESLRKKIADEQNAFMAKGAALEAKANGDKTNGRTITSEQIELFTNLLKNYPKMPIKVFVKTNDSEALVYAQKIRHLLDAADYGGNGSGIIPTDGEIFVGTNFTKWQPSPHTLIFVGFPINDYGFFLPINVPFNSINPVVSSGLTNDPAGYAAASIACINWGFSGIGLNGFFITNTNLLKRGEAGIIVPPRAN